ncbi:hypothetical protein B0H10DRAFT_1954102 [Mycena sp. CBHHK59/15]|nr:hypothetical protein B0H10DRAFT_1954102 [Mycena sp. CBHHK59/15]
MNRDDALEDGAVKQAKLERFERVLRDLIAADPTKTRSTLQKNGINNLRAFVQGNAKTETSEPVWDKNDRIYRCPECMWELEEGLCTAGGCGIQFDVNGYNDGVLTSNQALNYDRTYQPRGDTPLQDVESHLIPAEYYTDPSKPPWNNPGRFEEYEQLRRRGATYLMCKTFHLEFHSDVGIVAWADGDIYDEFAGPLMQKGDFWKIMLGRSIELEEDDPDGSAFLEALLEDALLFPLPSARWETVEESPGIWVTRALPPPKYNDSDDSSSSFGSESDSMVPWAFQWEEKIIEPDYVVPSLPVRDVDHYQTSDAESDMECEGSFTEQGDDGYASDPGWAFEANVPNAPWLSADSEDEEEPTVAPVAGAIEGGVIPVDVDGPEIVEDGERCTDDSADSDFDSDEILSGDEPTLTTGQRMRALGML